MNHSSRALLIFPLAFLIGCASKKDAESLIKDVGEIKGTVEKIQERTSGALYYEIRDIGRNQIVGGLRTNLQIGVGDRIFLNGDDMWDVKFIKVHAIKSAEIMKDGEPIHRVVLVELLATFGGKATQDKKS